jgi:hypothetical protein
MKTQRQCSSLLSASNISILVGSTPASPVRRWCPSANPSRRDLETVFTRPATNFRVAGIWAARILKESLAAFFFSTHRGWAWFMTICETCSGAGVVRGTETIACEACVGTGRVLASRCDHCNGTGSQHVAIDVLCAECSGTGRCAPHWLVRYA